MKTQRINDMPALWFRDYHPRWAIPTAYTLDIGVKAFERLRSAFQGDSLQNAGNSRPYSQPSQVSTRFCSSGSPLSGI